MSDFDFFGDEEHINNEEPSNDLELSFNFDYENLLNDGIEKIVKLCASVKPSDELRRLFENSETAQSTHVCLVIDTSDSMAIIVDNTNSVRTGKTKVGEDGKTYNIVTGGVSKLEIAVKSAKKVVDLLREGDTLSCITYDDEARVIFDDMHASDREEILNHLDNILGNYGFNTNVSDALLLSDKLLSEYEDALPKRVIFFTDGIPTGDDNEVKGINAGKILADHNVTVESMGFGEKDVNFPYLQKISSFSGGITTLIKFPDQFTSVFASLFEQSQSIIVTNVKLVLKLTSGTKVLDYYRGTPDNVYLGNYEGSDEKVLELNLGQIEKKQMYKYYFNVKLPGVENDYEGPINTMNAELHYFIPGRYDDAEQIIKLNVPINYTSDKEEASFIDGEVNTLFRLAEVKRFEDEREKAYNAGNKEETVKWLKQIIEVYKDLQKPLDVQNYTNMLDEYMKTNKISLAVLNRATSSSSQAQETGILDDLENEERSKFADRLRSRRRK